MRIAPGATIGIVGGGQLGRMLSVAAAQLGYRTHIFAPDADPPAGDVAFKVTQSDYSNEPALRCFADSVDIATYEFENLPAASLAMLGDKLFPGTASLEIAQDRGVEKRFLESQGARVAPWRTVDSPEDLGLAEAALGFPFVLKSRRLGYDGKGQAWAHTAGSALPSWDSIGREPAVAEAAVEFGAEFSVILARSHDGEVAVWDSPLNHHEGGILRRSTVPAQAPVAALLPEATAMAAKIAHALSHVGVLTVEFFATADGPIVNEIAPRVHNSGHWTIEGAATSQFEQHIRAICGLPLGSTKRVVPSVTMDNLIGDDVLAWEGLLSDASANLHLYGKGDPRPGRKMGHVTRLLD
jgi:5-(carboxyamino)imidazole ribonucleotide synthase